MRNIFLISVAIFLSACAMQPNVAQGENPGKDAIVIARFNLLPENSLVFPEKGSLHVEASNNPLFRNLRAFEVERGNPFTVTTLAPGGYKWGVISNLNFRGPIEGGKNIPQFEVKSGCINYVGDVTMDFSNPTAKFFFERPNEVTLNQFKSRYPKMFEANSVCQNDPYILGILSFNSRNYEIAKQYWKPLSDAGDCDAQYRYGTLYFFGTGVPQDYETANKWWLTAANQGQATAQMLLATMYAHDYMEIHSFAFQSHFNCDNRCGYQKDMETAYQWARLAERYTPYESFREFTKARSAQFKQSLTPEQITKAERYVQEWKPSPALCQQRNIP